MAKIYGVDRVPAVVIDDQYIAYGVSVTKAIKAYQQYLSNIE